VTTQTVRTSGHRASVHRPTLVLCLLAVWVLWGTVYLAIRLVIDEVPPIQAMAQRFLLAGLLLAGMVVVRRGLGGLRVSRRELAALVLTGALLLGGGNGLQALALAEGLPSGVSALVVAAVPAWAVLLRLMTGDRPATLTLMGVSVGFLGLALLVVLGRGVGGTMPLVGVALSLAASVAWTVGAYLQGVVPVPRDVLTVAAYQQFVAAACSVLLAVGRGEEFSVDYSARGWFALGYLVVACSVVAFLAFAWLLGHVSLSLTATHAYVNPVVAVFLGWLVLAEPLGVPVLVGGGVVVAAVVLILRSERPREVPTPHE